MTALAQRIKETPMAPYTALMRGMSRQDIQIVVKFLNEVMTEADEAQRLQGCMKQTETRQGWEAAAKLAHEHGDDVLVSADVFEDDKVEDWQW